MSYILQELSLIIPTKNDHYRIKDNLKDILDYLESKIKNFEVLIVSNKSSNQSIEYLEALASYNAFIKHEDINLRILIEFYNFYKIWISIFKNAFQNL